jgi:hypothetical protein
MAVNTAAAADSGNHLPYDRKLIEGVALAAIQDELSLWGHPALVDVAGMTSMDIARGAPVDGVLQLTVRDGADIWGATNESTALASSTTVTPLTVTIAGTSYDIAYAVTDELRRRDATDQYDLERLAAHAVDGAMYTFTSLVCALAEEWDLVVGTSGAPCTWNLVKRATALARIAAKARAEQVPMCILHPRQWAQVEEDFASADGARAHRRDLDEAQMVKPAGYQGRFDEIDVYTCDRVSEDSGVYTGQVFFPGGVGYVTIKQPPPVESEYRVLDIGDGMITIEEIRDGTNKRTTLAGAMTLGVAILRQALGCAITSSGLEDPA